MRVLFFSTIVLLMTSSCAFHSGMMTGNAAITNPNFQYVALAQGTATTTHVFGIGGIKKTALIFEAKKDLLKRYPLRKGQALANVTVDMKKTYAFCVVKTRATVTADVVDFNMSQNKSIIDTQLVSNYLQELSENLDILTGDSVYFLNHGHIDKGAVDRLNGNTFRIKYTGAKGAIFYMNANMATTLLKANGKNNVVYKNFQTGEKVRVLLESEMKEAIIFGINATTVGVKYDFKPNGSFQWKMVPLGRIQKLN